MYWFMSDMSSSVHCNIKHHHCSDSLARLTTNSLSYAVQSEGHSRKHIIIYIFIIPIRYQFYRTLNLNRTFFIDMHIIICVKWMLQKMFEPKNCVVALVFVAQFTCTIYSNTSII